MSEEADPERGHSTPIRVHVVDDHEIVRRGLLSYLASAGDIDVVGESKDTASAVGAVSSAAIHGPAIDVLLLDLTIPGGGGAEVVRRIARLPRPPAVVVLSAYGEAERIASLLDLGVAGYVLKSSPPRQILDAVRTAAEGGSYLDPHAGAELASRTPGRRLAVQSLTRREREVVGLVARGYSNLDIAAALFISERTARTHVSHVLTKTGLGSRVQLALWAKEHGVDSSLAGG